MHKRRVTLAFAPFMALMLVAQLALTAAHLHLGAPHRTEAGAVAARPEAEHRGDPLSPADEGHAPCALCWAKTVVGGLFAPADIPLPSFHTGLSVALSASTQAPRGKVWPRAFRPRAPPPSPV